ncbi:hypothetical protein [Pedobacter frigoris]|uniref:DUF4292 domain-containing protein n=1 Tax=Pedobacter frigoris TaxID=2571272 RepID=A0A4U1CHR3_9SPHI|nr:hypothetical protein [Pedobacter frigoris]TKC04167.1 hypothetical protein FA047_16320 [Pedobacter frigoris]
MRKALYFLFLLLVGLAFGCNQGTKHPQADLINKNSTEALTDSAILQLADSIDKNQQQMEKYYSLVYQTKNEHTYVERFTWNGIPQLLIEHIKNEGLSSITRKYYFKDNDLILIKENRMLMKSDGSTFDDKRTYLRNNISFKQDARTGHSLAELQRMSFADTKQSKMSNNTDDYTKKIDLLNQMIEGSNNYEMVFDRFISTPDTKYILLKSKIPSDYSATILVNENDALTDSLASDPSIFKEEKLNMNWKIENDEAFYVPVAAKVTSASGLKR